jgi:two-component system cit operon sensor histidine kinase CitA
MKRRLSFQVKLFLALVCFSCLLLVLLGTILFHFIDRQLHHDLGQRARVQASQIALMPGLAAMVAARDIPGIARLIQPLRAESDASYIVIGDTEEQHLYHSESPERINLPMIGGDNAEVLKGKTIISVRQGGIGVSLRSKAPIFNAQHQVIGIVSVGYLTSYIANINARILWQSGLYGAALCCCCLFSPGCLPATSKNRCSDWSRKISLSWFCSSARYWKPCTKGYLPSMVRSS